MRIPDVRRELPGALALNLREPLLSESKRSHANDGLEIKLEGHVPAANLAFDIVDKTVVNFCNIQSLTQLACVSKYYRHSSQKILAKHEKAAEITKKGRLIVKTMQSVEKESKQPYFTKTCKITLPVFLISLLGMIGSIIYTFKYDDPDLGLPIMAMFVFPGSIALLCGLGSGGILIKTPDIFEELTSQTKTYLKEIDPKISIIQGSCLQRFFCQLKQASVPEIQSNLQTKLQTIQQQAKTYFFAEEKKEEKKPVPAAEQNHRCAIL